MPRFLLPLLTGLVTCKATSGAVHVQGYYCSCACARIRLQLCMCKDTTAAVHVQG
jgi:hypothetical protein